MQAEFVLYIHVLAKWGLTWAHPNIDIAALIVIYYKWKNHFYEMKGDVGIMKKKGTRRCLHQDTKSLITPSLHLCFAFYLFVMNALYRQSKQHNTTSLTSNCLHENVRCSLGRNKDVGMGL